MVSKVKLGFCSGSDGKESTCNAGDPCSTSGLGGSPQERNGNPLHIKSRLNNFVQAMPFFSTTLQNQPIGWKLPFGSSCFHLLIFLLLGEQFFLFCSKIWGDLLCFRGTKVSISVPESHVWSISCLPRMRCGGPYSPTTGSAWRSGTALAPGNLCWVQQGEYSVQTICTIISHHEHHTKLESKWMKIWERMRKEGKEKRKQWSGCQNTKGPESISGQVPDLSELLLYHLSSLPPSPPSHCITITITITTITVTITTIIITTITIITITTSSSPLLPPYWQGSWQLYSNSGLRIYLVFSWLNFLQSSLTIKVKSVRKSSMTPTFESPLSPAVGIALLIVKYQLHKR